MDACFLATRFSQVLIHALGQERHDGCEQLRQCHEDGIQSLISRLLVGALFAFPEAPAIAADVPVAQAVVHKLLGLNAEGHHVEAFKGLSRRAHQKLQVGENPAVDVRTLRDGHLRSLRVEAVEPRVVTKECVRVPQLEDEAAAHLISRRRAKVDVEGRVLPAIKPAHNVRAHGRIRRKQGRELPVLNPRFSFAHGEPALGQLAPCLLVGFQFWVALNK